ncbi:MAG TPA: START domain-containing protein [Edaphocola sp.]|nr:START domain-containing protein [Edaphocola sp.]
MKKGTFILLCWLLPAMIKIAAVHAGDFKLVGREKQISLFERWIPSSKDMTVRELKAVFVVHSDIPAIVKLLQDERRSARWNVNATDFKILKMSSEDHWISYTRYDIPWPLDDQDCCLAYQLAGDFDRTVINFRSISSQYFPVTEDVERITGVRGKWILEKEKNNSIKVVYLITTDRSKKVPRWISDKIIHSNLYNTMAAFKTMAEQA